MWLETDQPDDVIAFCRCHEDKHIWFVGNARKETTVVVLNEAVPLTAERTIARNGEQVDGHTFKLEPHGFVIIRD